MLYGNILYMVEMGNIHVLCMAYDRESAKNIAHRWMGGNADTYTVTPLTEVGDRLHVELSLNV